MQSKILLVDDREDNLLSMETILEGAGYTFVKASSGKEALKILLREFDFALILMDVKMPNMDGFETARLIYEREKLRSIPIVFITAQSLDDEYVFRGYHVGAVDYISKPINSGLLRAKVAVFVDLYQKTHHLKIQEQKLIAINKHLENEIDQRLLSEEKVKALNMSLQEHIDRLESANKELDRFAYMASHDLQEPMRKIQTFTDMLLRRHSENLNGDGKDYLHRIQGTANRMQTLIQHLISFAKIPSQTKDFVDCDLNVILKDVLDEMKTEVKEKKAEIISSKLPVLRVNPVLIRPLFVNLIGNALKYSRKDISPVVKIYCDANGQKAGKKYYRIYFEDNGIGFEQKHAEHLFDMFARLHDKTEVDGSGIGLAFCKKIVEGHSGFISALGRENAGATFIVALPASLNGFS
jgi:signal transduction histidine kinase